MKKGSLTFRLPESQKKRFMDIHDELGRDASETLREVVQSMIVYYEVYKNLYPPFEVHPGPRDGTRSGKTESSHQ